MLIRRDENEEGDIISMKRNANQIHDAVSGAENLKYC